MDDKISNPAWENEETLELQSTEVESLEAESQREYTPQLVDDDTHLESSNGEYYEAQDYDVPDDFTVDTKRPLWSSPWLKLGLVSTLVMFVISSAGLGMTLLFSAAETTAETEPEETEVAEASTDDYDFMDASASAQQSDPIALAEAQREQSAQLSALETVRQGQELAGSLTAEESEPVGLPRPSPSPAAVAPPPPPPAPRYNPPPPPPAPIAVGHSVPVPPVAPPLDPARQMEKSLSTWNAIAQVGAFGGMPEPQLVSSTAGVIDEASSSRFPSQENSELGNLDVVAQSPSQEARIRLQTEIEAAPMSNGERRLLTGQSLKSITIGGRARAQLVTPGVYTPTLGGQQFVVTLAEPLYDSQGQIGLPSGTQLIAQMQTVEANGFSLIKIETAVLESRHGLKEIPLPEGALHLYGEGGEPIIASKEPDNGGNIASLDLGLFALGALAKVGEIYNRPNEDVIVTDDTVVTATRNPQPNALAAIAEGGINAILGDIQSRTQRAVKESLSEDKQLWLVRTEQPVEVLVARSFSLS